MKKILLSFVVILIFVISFFSGKMPDSAYKILPGYFADPNLYWQESPFVKNQVTQAKLPAKQVSLRQTNQVNSLAAFGVTSDTQILFGDTHVHTTNSSDAFMFSLPLMHGAQGAFPPGYACDYARFVSQLDFYFLTDHSESYTPERWHDAIESVNKCNLASQQGDYQDTYAFMGYEWTQVGVIKEEHYGHHNVLFKDTSEGNLPSRPIAAKVKVSTVAKRDSSSKLSKMLEILDPRHKDYYAAYNSLIDKMAGTPNCAADIPSNELPADCYEQATTTGELYKKLNEWDIDTIVVPHGMTWGLYTPPDASWESHLNATDVDNNLASLIEVYSGHGGSEQYRSFDPRPKNAAGQYYCPEPQKDYLPGCWQAGEIIRQRCLDENSLEANNSAAECDNRAITARQNFVNTDDKTGFLTVPSHKPEEWLDAEQVRNMFNPAFSYRPKKSAQYGLALRNFDDPENPLGFQWGFIASTDTHTARVGHGFKQVGRVFASEANGPREEFWQSLMIPDDGEYQSSSRTREEYDPAKLKLRAAQVERVGSFLYLGGLAAVHVDERSREGIWQGMKNKRVYGTSGHKIMLWFDMINNNNKLTAPMGSSVDRKENPSFKVTAVGSPIQEKGCPDHVNASLDSYKLEKMSLGECFNPTDKRYTIQRIEITRIKPQSYQDEPVESLIENSWKVFQCPQNTAKCEVTFTDEEYSNGARDTFYYARVIEQAIPMINADTLHTKFDENGQAVSVNICQGSFKTAQDDDCLASEGHRAWSSPIFVNYK